MYTICPGGGGVLQIPSDTDDRRKEGSKIWQVFFFWGGGVAGGWLDLSREFWLFRTI